MKSSRIKDKIDKIISEKNKVKKLPYSFKTNEMVLYKKGVEFLLLKVYAVNSNSQKSFVHARSIKSKSNDEVYDIINCKIDGTPVTPFFVQEGDEIYITNQVGGHRYVVGKIDYEPNAGYFAELGYVENLNLQRVKLLLADIIDYIKF